MKCQFCQTIFKNKDEVQLHQASSCPAIENEIFTGIDHPCVEVVFRWMKDGNESPEHIYVLLSDLVEQIELKCDQTDSNIGRYLSQKIPIQVGRYCGQIVIDNEMFPVEALEINLQSCMIDLKIEGKIVVFKNDDNWTGASNEEQVEMVKFAEKEDRNSNGVENGAMTNKGKYVSYKLNKQLACEKKIVACDRDVCQVELKSSSCVITLSTAAFEYFKEDLVLHLRIHYKVVKEKPTIDQAGNVTQDTYVVNSNENVSKYLFTINLYRTKSNAMVNGAKYMRFVDDDLPVLTAKLYNRESLIDQVNEQIKVALPQTIFLEEQAAQVPETHYCSDQRRRIRKKRNFEGYVVGQIQRKTRSSTGSSCDEGEKNSQDDMKEYGWNSKPKFWEKFGYGEWTQEMAKECFKPKGCLMNCGKNNSRDMVMCDACGRWCHYRCTKEEVSEEKDFLCQECQSRSVGILSGSVVIEETLCNEQENVIEPKDDSVPSCEGDDEVDGNSTNDDLTLGGTAESQMGCLETNEMCKEKEAKKGEKKEPVRKKRQAKEIILPIENQVSWWKDDALRNLRNHLIREQQFSDETVIVNEKRVVPFKAEQPQMDGIIGGEAWLTVKPCGDDSAAWMEKSEIRTIHVNCAELLKSWQNDDAKSLYQVIIKLKQKLSLLKGQNAGQNVIPQCDSTALNKLTQELEKSEKRALDLKERNKKLVAENNELKSGKKSLMDQHKDLKNNAKRFETERDNLVVEKNKLSDEMSKLLLKREEFEQSEKKSKDRNDELTKENDNLKNVEKEKLKECLSLRTTIKSKDAEIKNLSKVNKELSSQLELLNNKMAEAQQKQRIMEEVAGDVCINENKNIYLTSADKSSGLEDKVQELEEKVMTVSAEKSKLESLVAENDRKLKWTNESYQEIIGNKDKVITSLTAITEEGSIENKYKMLLMHYKSELELQSIQDLKQKVQRELYAKSSGEQKSEDVEMEDKSSNSIVGKQQGAEGGQVQGAKEADADHGNKVMDGQAASDGGMFTYQRAVNPDRKLMRYIKEGLSKDAKKDGGKQGNSYNSSSRNKICWAFDKCTTAGCTFLHTVPNNDIMKSKKSCWFGERCSRNFCPFVHPKRRPGDETLESATHRGYNEQAFVRGGDVLGISVKKRTIETGSSEQLQCFRRKDGVDRSISQRLANIANSDPPCRPEPSDETVTPSMENVVNNTNVGRFSRESQSHSARNDDTEVSFGDVPPNPCHEVGEDTMLMSENLSGASGSRDNFGVRGLCDQQIIGYGNSLGQWNSQSPVIMPNEQLRSGEWNRPVVYVSNGTPLSAGSRAFDNNLQYSNVYTKNEIRNTPL